jgi:ParB family transcriptional regulator, chromosome partitioning protein
MGATTKGKQSSPGGPEYVEIAVDQLEPDPAFSQWTNDPDRLCGLPEGTEQHGPIPAIVVRRVPGRQKLQIVCGEQTWLAAARDPSVHSIRCAVYDDLSEDRALILRLTEALTLVRLRSLELGGMIARVQELRGWSLHRLARELNASVNDLRGPLAIPRMPIAVQDMVRRGELRGWHAYQISLAPEEDRQAIAEEVVSEGLNREHTQALIRRRLAAKGMTLRERRWWYLRAPIGFHVFVMGPPKSHRLDLQLALAQVLTAVLNWRFRREIANES